MEIGVFYCSCIIFSISDQKVLISKSELLYRVLHMKFI